jgi:pimeloyl-ACP methyl ester carboxylesterase
MADHPETRYATTADGVHVAYQVIGDGPIDVLHVMGWVTNIEWMWTLPEIRKWFDRMSTFARVMVFDKRGVGLSDRISVDALPSLEVRMDDARAVMDAAGSERAVVLGHSEGGPMATLFAATYPERTIGLVLFGTSLCWNNAPDYEFHMPDQDLGDEQKKWDELRERLWGTKELARMFIAESFSPSRADDDVLQAWVADYMRQSASPGAALALGMMNRGMDARAAASAVHVPTLVLAREGDLDYAVEETRWIADHIRGARFASYEGDDHFIFLGEQTPLLDEIEAFVAEVRGQEADLDRVLAHRDVHRHRGFHREGRRARRQRMARPRRTSPRGRPRPARPVPRHRGRHRR